MIRSLRGRLLLSTSLSIGIVLGLLGVTIYFSVWRSLLAEFDRGLLAQARTVAVMAEQDGRRVRFEFEVTQFPEFAAKSRPEYFQAWLDNGSVLKRSESLGKRDLEKTAASLKGNYSNVFLPDGHWGRAISLLYTPRVEEQERGESTRGRTLHSMVLMVARDTSVLRHTMEELRWLLLALFGAAILVSGAVLVVVVARAMIPVRRLAREIEGLKETSLGNLETKDVPLELTPVVEKLNGSLSRLSQAFAREKAFTADVAHELRTPLAGLQTTLEVCRSRPRDAVGYEAAIDKCRSMTDRMQAMIENLLLLARAEGGQLVLDQKGVDLSLLLQECWATLQHRAESRHLNVKWNVPENCIVQTDREKLSIVIQNLLGNAVAYGDEGGVINISARALSDGVFLEIANSGSKISGEDAAHLFERFWRGDASRSDTGAHYGLGLSLCQRLMKLLKGDITIQTAQGEMFVARLSLP